MAKRTGQCVKRGKQPDPDRTRSGSLHVQTYLSPSCALGTASHDRKRNKSMFLSPLCYRLVTAPETENMVREYEANAIIKICLKCDGR